MKANAFLMTYSMSQCGCLFSWYYSASFEVWTFGGYEKSPLQYQGITVCCKLHCVDLHQRIYSLYSSSNRCLWLGCQLLFIVFENSNSSFWKIQFRIQFHHSRKFKFKISNQMH